MLLYQEMRAELVTTKDEVILRDNYILGNSLLPQTSLHVPLFVI